MYFLGINKKTPHSHQKTKIKFIFLAELMILILGKNVQLFLQTCKLHIFFYKVLRFFSYYNFCNFFIKKIECSLTFCKYSCNCYHFRWLWRKYGTFTTRERSENRLVIFSLLGNLVETCMTLELNWIRNCWLW